MECKASVLKMLKFTFLGTHRLDTSFIRSVLEISESLSHVVMFSTVDRILV